MGNNQEKVKKILFGGKNLGGDPLWNTEGVPRDNPETKMNEAALHGWKPESQWNDPEMTGPVDVLGIKIIEDTLGIVGENEFKVLNSDQAAAYERLTACSKISAKPEKDYFVWDNKTGESRKANKDEIGEPITIKFERPLKFFQLAKNPQLSEPESSQLVASEKPEVDEWKRNLQDPITDEQIIAAMRKAQEMAWVEKYCSDNWISPIQLIEQHAYWAKMAHELHAEAIKKATDK